jgi:hypothetical protein
MSGFCLRALRRGVDFRLRGFAWEFRCSPQPAPENGEEREEGPDNRVIPERKAHKHLQVSALSWQESVRYVKKKLRDPKYTDLRTG